MNRLFIIVALALLAAGQTRAQQNNPALNKLFASAEHKATVDGNLKGAIEDYKRIVATVSHNRATVAQALLKMAECYQLLGNGEARKVYEQIVAKYGDLREAGTARARLAKMDSPVAQTTNRRITSVPVGGVGYGTVSPDGRYFPYTNWADGDLYLRDLVTGSDRRLTNVSGLSEGKGQFAAQAAFSKDGRQLAYSWLNDRRAEIRIIDTARAAGTQPRLVFRNDDITNVWPDDWSADGKWVAVQLIRADKTAQMGLIGVRDGTLRVLKSVDWRGATRLMFSPDGRYLSYDLPASDTDNRRDIFVLAVDGSHEATAVKHPANDLLMGWSPDGSTLLFSSDRSGTVALWRLPVGDGRPADVPELLRPHIEGAPLGVTPTGALYSLVHSPRFNAAVSANVQVADFDFNTGRFRGSPSSPVQEFVGMNNFPVWSPDGKSLAYVSVREAATDGGGANTNSRVVIAIRSVDTGVVRQIPVGLNMYPNSVRWSADGRSFVTQGKDIKGRQGLYRINAQTGAVSAVALSGGDDELRSPSESVDGTRIYYMRGYVGQPERELTVIERDLRTGNERELLRGRSIFAPGPAPLLSPDGQSIIVSSDDPVKKSSALLLVPVAGGQAREIIRMDSPLMVRVQAWAPDGRSILAVASRGFMGGVGPVDGGEVWQAPLDAGKARKLDLNVVGMTPFSVHPDGRQIAYGLTEPAKDDEVWVLENFLPSRKK